MSGPALLSCRRVVFRSAQHPASWVNYNHPASFGRVSDPGTSLSVRKCSHANIACWQEPAQPQPSITGVCSPVYCRITPHSAVSTTTSWTSAQHTARHTHGHLVNSKTLPTISRPVGTCSSDSKTTHNHQQSQLAAA